MGPSLERGAGVTRVIMAPMKRPVLGLLFGLALPLGACSTAQSASVQQESEACYRPRSFTEEFPQMYWGDPVRDPCWRFRRVVPDR